MKSEDIKKLLEAASVAGGINGMKQDARNARERIDGNLESLADADFRALIEMAYDFKSRSSMRDKIEEGELLEAVACDMASMVIWEWLIKQTEKHAAESN